MNPIYIYIPSRGLSPPSLSLSLLSDVFAVSDPVIKG